MYFITSGDLQEKIIISLGSNLGNRLETLYKALALLESYPVSVSKLSKVYETPSWGFESSSFYNACAILETALDPQELLRVLLKVEQQLGRYRKEDEQGYIDRTVDLDILFYKKDCIYSANLKVPHPRMHRRNFVLAPLLDIAPDFEHPILGQTMASLFRNTPDKAIAVCLDEDLGLPPIFDRFPYIAIEGNIGVGKTTLAQKIAAQYAVRILSESYTENPYLEAFYKDPKTHALAVENFFLKDRFKKDTEFWQASSQQGIADFSLYKSLVFAQENLSTPDFESYRKAFDAEIGSKKKPNLLLFLKTDLDQLQAQIKKRGRPFEQNITSDYLEQLEAGYAKFFQNKLPFPVVAIALENMDFEKDKTAFQKILRTIFRHSFSYKNPKLPSQQLR